MSRFIHIIDGDYGEQIAEFVLTGLRQNPAIELRTPKHYRNWLKRPKIKWVTETWIIGETISKIEKLDEGLEFIPETEWHPKDLTSQPSGLTRFIKNLTPPSKTSSPRQSKKIHFRLTFKNGTNCTAIADARVFQNIHSLVE